MAEIDRELGEIGARLDAHDERLDEIGADVKKLLDYAARTKGGWWAIGVVGTIGGGIGAAIMKLVGLVKGAG